MNERMKLAKCVNSWWAKWDERRRHLWHTVINSLHWEHDKPVQHKVDDGDRVKVNALSFDLPVSVALARHAADKEEYEVKMKCFQDEHEEALAIVTKDEETKTEQMAAAVERALKKDKGKMILNLFACTGS